MSNSILTVIGLVLGLGGVFLGIIFSSYMAWKPYFKNEPLSQSEFIRACVLIGFSTLISACGMWLWAFIPDWQRFLQPDYFFLGIFGTALCLGGLPAFTVGIFVWQMKMWGFVKRDRK